MFLQVGFFNIAGYLEKKSNKGSMNSLYKDLQTSYRCEKSSKDQIQVQVSLFIMT
uniref:Uncharacterized protein n=1 Tax=Kuenenia stuttgartiensis TaxID=174633 RepID=Q1Q0S7_KUEST|nr:unknown protein [Candidatus Kuenenia stuttgartiensis]